MCFTAYVCRDMRMMNRCRESEDISQKPPFWQFFAIFRLQFTSTNKEKELLDFIWNEHIFGRVSNEEIRGGETKLWN